jgi:DNA end-binding protein Ku
LSIGGLVTAGIKLQSAARTISVSLKGLHKKCHEDPTISGDITLNQLYRCKACSTIISNDDRLSGYPLDGGYVVLTEEEVKGQLAMPDDVLTVQALIPEAQVPHLRLDKSYYVGPQAPPKIFKGQPVFTSQHRTFEMFRSHLEDSERVAVVTYAERGHEKIAVMYPLPVGALLFEAFFDNEIPEITAQFKDGTFTVPELTVKEKGLGALFMQGLFADTFPWEAHEDGYVARVHALAVAKASGDTLVQVTPTPAPSESDSLEAALAAALAAQQHGKAA